jgi:hypothetical protein
MGHGTHLRHDGVDSNVFGIRAEADTSTRGVPGEGSDRTAGCLCHICGETAEYAFLIRTVQTVDIKGFFADFPPAGICKFQFGGESVGLNELFHGLLLVFELCGERWDLLPERTGFLSSLSADWLLLCKMVIFNNFAQEISCSIFRWKIL